jgi:outer membrane protein
MRKALAIVSSLLLMSATQVYAADAVAAQPTLAVVNVQQLFQSSPKIADLNKQLQAKFKPRQEKLLSSQKTLSDEVEKFKKESPTMSQKDKDALQKKITGDQAVLQKEAAAFQQDLNKEQGKVMKGVLAQLNSVIASIAKKNNYSLVLDSQAVIYAADSSDITKQVSKEFDTK